MCNLYIYLLTCTDDCATDQKYKCVCLTKFNDEFKMKVRRDTKFKSFILFAT